MPGVVGEGSYGILGKPWPLRTYTAQTTAWRVPRWPPTLSGRECNNVLVVKVTQTRGVECGVDAGWPRTVCRAAGLPDWPVQAGVPGQGGVGAPHFSCSDLHLLSVD